MRRGEHEETEKSRRHNAHTRGLEHNEKQRRRPDNIGTRLKTTHRSTEERTYKFPPLPFTSVVGYKVPVPIVLKIGFGSSEPYIE